MSTHAHDCPADPETVALDVTALSHGPDAVARRDGRVVFVRGGAPGDRVHARIVEERPNWSRAEIVHRCRDGSARREPPCPWVDACGGCAWQHVDYAAQLAAKAVNVHEALARIGGIDGATELPIIAAPDEWRYRHRIRLHVGADRALGYRRGRSHAIVSIDDCVIADATLASALPTVRTGFARLRTRLRDVELIANGRGAVVVAATATSAIAAEDDARLAALVGADGIAGVHVEAASEARTIGDVRVFVTPDNAGTTIVQRPGTFSQVHPAANRLLVATVQRMVADAARVLDLFCGAGNLSLPLARSGIEVVGVDASPAAIADARASAAGGSLTNVRFEVAPALRFLGQQGLAGADLVVLDPPRAGAAAEVAQLTRLRPRRLVYVSCDPATLARDAGMLRRAGYLVAQVQPIDLFPQTPHVETVLSADLAID